MNANSILMIASMASLIVIAGLPSASAVSTCAIETTTARLGTAPASGATTLSWAGIEAACSLNPDGALTALWNGETVLTGTIPLAAYSGHFYDNQGNDYTGTSVGGVPHVGQYHGTAILPAGATAFHYEKTCTIQLSSDPSDVATAHTSIDVSC